MLWKGRAGFGIPGPNLLVALCYASNEFSAIGNSTWIAECFMNMPNARWSDANRETSSCFPSWSENDMMCRLKLAHELITILMSETLLLNCLCLSSGQPDPELSAAPADRQSSSDANHLHRPPLLPVLCGSPVHGCIHCLEVWRLDPLWPLQNLHLTLRS